MQVKFLVLRLILCAFLSTLFLHSFPFLLRILLTFCKLGVMRLTALIAICLNTYINTFYFPCVRYSTVKLYTVVYWISALYLKKKKHSLFHFIFSEFILILKLHSKIFEMKVFFHKTCYQVGKSKRFEHLFSNIKKKTLYLISPKRSGKSLAGTEYSSYQLSINNRIKTNLMS